MELVVTGQKIEVVLSERNLLSLLVKLYQPESLRTLERWSADFQHILSMRVETDKEHYGDRKPGPRSPETERIVQALQKALEETR